MSGGRERSCSRKSPSVCTNTTEAAKPPARRASAASSASSWLSSTCSTRSELVWGARALAVVICRSCQMPDVLSRERGLIGAQPVQSYALHRPSELVEVDRLLDVAVSPQVVTSHQVALFFGGGHDHHRDGSGPGIALDLFQHFHAIDFGKL